MVSTARKKQNDYGTGIPLHEVEALVLLPEIQRYFESEQGRQEFTEWKEQRDVGKIKAPLGKGRNV